MAKNKTLINIHTKRYVEAVFENRLREEGFTCPDDKYLCWYRVENREIVNTIIFFSSWSNMPLMLNIKYGIHPLFTKPIYTRSVSFSNNIVDDVRFCYQRLEESKPIKGRFQYNIYSPDIEVYAPPYDGWGVYTFDEILLPKMDAIHTIEDCYEYHKQRRLNFPDKEYPSIAAKFDYLPASFFDMAVWVDDKEMYPYSESTILREIDVHEWNCARFPDKAEHQDALQHWNQLKAAILDHGREDYLKILEKRKADNIRYLNKRLGIIV